jgi:hypothetical protein
MKIWRELIRGMEYYNRNSGLEQNNYFLELQLFLKKLEITCVKLIESYLKI